MNELPHRKGDSPPEMDPVLAAFLPGQTARAIELADQSDILSLEPLPAPFGPPTRFIARFRCRGVLRGEDGRIGPAESEFKVGIALRPDHLRSVDPLQLVTWLEPDCIVYPNIRPPFVCIGHVFPGIELVDVLYSVYEMIGYHNWASHDALNEEAAEWARNHKHLFPVENRPLKRRKRLSTRGGS